MLNDSKVQGIDVATATEATDDTGSELDNLERQVEAASMLLLQPSGSRTLDTRLNPDAPDFVPGLAVKIVNELSDYPRWSSAASEMDTYGPRYDSIWRESCLRAQVEADAEAAQQANRIDIVGDMGQQSPLDKRSKAASDAAESASIATTATATTAVTTSGRCCANCALM